MKHSKSKIYSTWSACVNRFAQRPFLSASPLESSAHLSFELEYNRDLAYKLLRSSINVLASRGIS